VRKTVKLLPNLSSPILAVQSERERFSNQPKNQSTESVETACQTDPLFADSSKMSAAFMWQQQLLDDELTK
jgi:hypothetical protein